MIMVAIGTFEWASLRTFRRMPTSDVFIMVLVTLVTAVLHKLGAGRAAGRGGCSAVVYRGQCHSHPSPQTHR